MAVEIEDLVPLSRVRARLTQLANEVRTRGREKVITRNGEAYVALIDARQLARYHRLAKEHATLTLLEDVRLGLQDAAKGNGMSVAQFRKHWGLES